MAAPPDGGSDLAVFTDKASPAVCQVFSTPELFENIYLNLPSSAAIRARGVCRYWRTFSQSSKALRQHIFLEAAPTTELFSWQLNDDETKQLPMIKPCERDHKLTEDDVPIRHLHPLLRRMPLREIPYACRWIDFVLDVDAENLKDDNGTWRDMLICQPPCHFDDLYIFDTTRAMSGDVAVKHKPRDFVTLGGLVELVERCCGKARGGVRIRASTLVDGDHANRARGDKRSTVYTAKLSRANCVGREKDVLYGFTW